MNTIETSGDEPRPQLNINLLVGVPGAGKTRSIVNTAATSPGRYLAAFPRRELIDEVMRDIEAAARSAGTRPLIIPIYSGKTDASVAREIADAATRYAHETHVIVLATHAGLVLSNLFGFAGWKFISDEIPETIASGYLTIPVSFAHYQQTYNLCPSPLAGWSEVTLRADAPTISALNADDHLKETVAFHRRAASPRGRLIVDSADWRDATVSGRTLEWLSMWTLDELSAFDTVTLAGAGIRESLTVHVSKLAADIQFHETDLSPATRQQPRIRVHYYSEKHVASSVWWTKPEGRKCLLAIAKDLAKRNVGYWSGNGVVTGLFEDRFPGQMVSPKVAGTNSLRHHTSCAFIYSAKAIPTDEIIIGTLGVTREDIARAREEEDIRQFVMRGMIRNLDYDGDYDIYLYDRAQALKLVEWLRGIGFTDVVDPICLVEAGISEVERPKVGRKAVIHTPETYAEWQERRREKERLKKQRQREKGRKLSREAGTGGPSF